MLEQIREALKGCRIYERSLRQQGGIAFTLAKDLAGEKFLYVRGEELPSGFVCEEAHGGWGCPLIPENAFALQQLFPWLRPRAIGIKRASFGFGDRLGLATPGHVRSVREQEIFPVFAQQSIREMERTGRSPEEVMATAIWGIFQEGYTSGFGADADHLKTVADLDKTVPLGFTLYTCDPSDYVNDRASTMSAAELQREFEHLEEHRELRRRYLKQRFELHDPETKKIFKLELNEEKLQRAAVKYFPAVRYTIQMYQALKDRLKEFDFELSVDETETPTTPEEHFFIVNELQRAGVHLSGLAPRFVGEFQKGIDYIGDLNELKEQLQAHATLARSIGPYKISVHSGSDKFRIYPLIRQYFGDLFHVKTAGTSYLEALHLLALEEPELFCEIYRFALSRYDEDKRTYHVTPQPRVPEPEIVPDKKLADLMKENNVRQLLHVTYGSVLTWKDSQGNYLFRERLLGAIKKHEERYYGLLEEHFKWHLDSLK